MSPTISFAVEATTSQRRTTIYTTPQKKQMISFRYTYLLAHSVRGKLSTEAARADHDLRLVVGHANILDSLMISLANAEQEQERCFNKPLFGVWEEETRHVDIILEDLEEDWEAEDAQSSAEPDYEEQFMSVCPVEIITTELDMGFDDEEDQSLALTKPVSRHSPPELTIEGDSTQKMSTFHLLHQSYSQRLDVRQ